MAYQVNGSRVEWNPTAARLRELAEKMPNASVTEFGNVSVKTRVDSRSTRSTYLVEDSTNACGQTITRAEYDRVAALQDARIAKSHMVVVDGYIGSDLLNGHEVQAFVLNTGRIGGGDDHLDSKKVTIPHSSATVQGIVEDTIEWTEDPDFGYEVAAVIPGVDDIEILQPRRLYARQSPDGRARRDGGQAQAGTQGVPQLLRRARRVPGQVAGLIRAGPAGTSAVNPSVWIVGYVCHRSSR